MRWLCLLLILAADPSSDTGGTPGNFARPKGSTPPTEKAVRPWQKRDQEKQEKREEAPRHERQPEPPEAELEELPPLDEPAMEAPQPEEPVPAAPESFAPAAKDGLSAYFGAELRPGDYAGIITALADRLNRQTLEGVLPENEFERYEEAAKSLRGDPREVRTLVDRLYGNMVRYLKLEAEFAVKPARGLLEDAAKLVRDQIDLDPNADPERATQIVQIMQANAQFPPASIVFGIPLSPFRRVKLPPGYSVMEVPREPEYVDEAQRAVAVFDFLSWPGPICRLDFEAARVGDLIVEQSHDKKTFTVVETVSKQEAGGVHGPLLLKEPVKARYLRVTGAGQTEPPMLRNVRASALKGPAVAAVPTALSPPELDASFKEAAYPRHAEVTGFVRPDGVHFADPPTEARLCHTADALVIGVYARDDRMKTMVAAARDHDAPLWTEESFEIRIRAGRRETLRFIVNPLGTRFESRGDDASWNGRWTAVTKNYSTGWAAEIAIPYETLGVSPRPGETLQTNFLRYRRNVTNEDSVWVAEKGRATWGTLAFH